MADFCYDCSQELLGVEPESNDFFGLIDEEKVEKGYLISVLCEGCGYIMVDHLGKKVGTIDETVENISGTKIQREDDSAS